MSTPRSESSFLTEEERKKRFPQVRCPMLEMKDGFSLPDSDTPQCTGKPDYNPPGSLKPYFQSVHFGEVKVCSWHSQRLSSKEQWYLTTLRRAFGEEPSRRDMLVLEVRCWHSLVR